MTEEQSTLIANFRYGVIAPMVVQPLAREQARMLRELAGRVQHPFQRLDQNPRANAGAVALRLQERRPGSPQTQTR